MPKIHDRKFEEIIITKTGDILAIYKNDEDTAYKLWQELDTFTSDKRKSLSPLILDLILQLEFLMEEEHSENEWNDIVNAYYLAKKNCNTEN